MEKQTDTYEPFGKEWESEMMKWRKPDLIQLLKKQLVKIQGAKEIITEYREGFDDPASIMQLVKTTLQRDINPFNHEQSK